MQQKSNSKGLVIYSGGLDSTTLLYKAMRECTRVEAVSFIYGQKHSRELSHASWICINAGIEHSIINVPDVFSGYGSTLIDEDAETPQMTYQEIREAEGPSPTYVPYRNGIFLSLGTAFAQARGLNTIYYGAHADDAHNWAYPDCTPSFIFHQASAIKIGTYEEVELIAPFFDMTKADIVKEGYSLGAPFEKSYSCYEGRAKHCGKCPTCVSRIEAFEQAGIPDPTDYEKQPV